MDSVPYCRALGDAALGHWPGPAGADSELSFFYQAERQGSGRAQSLSRSTGGTLSTGGHVQKNGAGGARRGVFRDTPGEGGPEGAAPAPRRGASTR